MRKELKSLMGWKSGLIASLWLCGMAWVRAASPIALEPSSFNVDIVFEKVPIGSLSFVTGTHGDDSLPSQSPDMRTGGDDRTWPEEGLVVRGVTSIGLPNSRVVTAFGATWQFRPYNENNVRQLQNWGRSGSLSGTITFEPTARVPYGKLDVLHAAAYQNVVYGVRLHFTDGTTADLGQNFLLLDWGLVEPTNRVLGTYGVMANRTDPSPFPASIRAGYDDGEAVGGNWGMYHQVFDLAAAGLDQKSLYGITFTNHTAANYSFFAVSGVALAPAAPPPVISIQRSGSAIEVTWDRGTLQQAENLNATWNDLPQASSPWVVDVSLPPRFFRVSY